MVFFTNMIRNINVFIHKPRLDIFTVQPAHFLTMINSNLLVHSPQEMKIIGISNNLNYCLIFLGVIF